MALAPSAAEILFALGAASRVVGVSDFARDLPESRGKSRVGGFNPDLERIAALRPDLIVVSRDGTDRSAAERLSVLGFRVLVTEGTSIDGVLADIRRVGAALDDDRSASLLVSRLNERVGRAEERALRNAVRLPKSAIVVIWPEPPVLAGPKTFVGDILRRAGIRNAAGANAGDWPRVSHETIAAWNPDVVIRPETAENRAAFDGSFLKDPRWLLVPAVRAGRIVTLPGEWLERPGPHLVDALERLVELFGPKP